jgi:phosphoserine aminotransferase
MSQPYNRVYNFSAGPCTLPVPVLEKARDEFLNYNGNGMGVMEMSHRSKAFETILEETEARFRQLLSVPDHYRVLFLQGGASTQFALIPMTFLKGGTADYIVTGTWGSKALEDAKRMGNVHVAYDGKSDRYNDAPSFDRLTFSDNAAFLHFTSNETIQGVQFKSDPDHPAPLVCDMSSDILSRPVDVSKYAMVYAGAQKNMGPAGVTVVVISDEMLEKVQDMPSPMFDYRVQAENNSLYNTAPTFGIYMCGLVYQHYLDQGGVEHYDRESREKSQVLYDAIDGSGGFYKGHALPHCRSTMNVTFTLPDEELTKRFVKESEAQKLDGLKGHRSVGGVRASIYNAFPKEGCETLAGFMKDFAQRNG